jgi:lipopolysaccharide assembly protein A
MTPDDLGRPLGDAPNDTGSTTGGRPAAAAPAGYPEPVGRRALPGDRVLHRTRTETWLFGVLGFVIVLVALLIFILQNSQTVAIHYFTARGHLPLAVAMLFAAIAGVLLVAIPTGVRVLQLRRTTRRRARDGAVPGAAGSVIEGGGDHRAGGPSA